MDAGEDSGASSGGVHFTYRPPDKTVLRQGDVLAKSGDLLELIRLVHPHYADDERVTHFQVLTQSCDLVRRKGKCAARYLTLAVVRPLASVFDQRISEYPDRLKIADISVCSEIYKLDLKQLVERLLNNNEASFFYLKAAPANQLSHDSCSVLPLSVAVRAYEHFDVCLRQKVLELAEPFQAKLGWKVGNLYSRVGTVDYDEGVGISDKEYGELVTELMNQHVAWVAPAHFAFLKKRLKRSPNTDDGMSLEELLREANTNSQKAERSRLDGLIAAIANVIEISEVQKDALRNALSQDPMVQKAIRRG